jgi:hypothetical protein
MLVMLHEAAKRHHAPGASSTRPRPVAPVQRELLVQRALANPASLSQTEVKRLQRLVGNRSVQRLLARGKSGKTAQRQVTANGRPVVQRADGDDDESWDLGELFKSDEDKEADRATSTYETMAPGMGGYAKRQAPDSMAAKSKAGTLLPYSKALSMPRLPDGTLSPEAIAIMNEEQGKEAQGSIDASRASGFKNAPIDKAGMRALKKTIKKATVGVGDAQLNSLTCKIRLPELMNLLKPLSGKALGAYQGATGKADESVVSSVEVAGVTMHVYHGVSDVNFRPRLKLFEGAIERIQGAGFKLPSTLLVHLPKFGRPIDVKAMCEVGGGTPRAVFAAPNFIHLSSAVVGNPIDETKGGDSYYTLSSNLDPEGPGTVIHEMGHMMHFQSSATNFYSLQGASHRQPMVARKVSTYATNNPREFVAEVFLGLVYGKSFDDDVIQMYRAFGGPTSPKIESQIVGAQAPAGGAGQNQ